MRITCLPNGWKVIFVLMAVLFAMAGLYGCSGSSSSDTQDNAGTQSESGEVAVSLTDAPGDFANYTVDVVSLKLTRANGSEVSTLPLETRLDFTQYTDMTEFLTAATVPAGVYVAATLTLDYTNADIWVEDDTETAVKVSPENILDENGDPVTTLKMTVQLEGRNRLPIAPGIPAHLLLDFDLNATHQVSLDDPQAPVVTVDPLLVAEVNRTSFKFHRVRGALNEVDVAAQTFSLFLRPFYTPLSGKHRHFGSRNITVTSDTVYEINGTQHTGAAGLEAMAGLDPLAAVVAIGDLKLDPLRFVARQVNAGSSVPGGTLDVVKGNVIRRQGDVLTVKGATLIRGDSSVVFNDKVTVNISDETIVTRQLSSDPVGTFGKDDISVGQRIVVFGTLSQTDDTLVLDADTSDHYVRMILTTLRGKTLAVDSAAQSLNLDVNTISHRSVDVFDFEGTGSDPGNFSINTGNLDLSIATVDAPLKVRGFVESFGSAPPDFTAQSIVSAADLRALLKVHWNPAADINDAFESVTTEALVLNLEGARHYHHIFRGRNRTDLALLESAVTMVPREDGRGAFIIRYKDGSTQIYTEFDTFAEALALDMEDHLKIRKLHAIGEFKDTSTTLTADAIEVRYAGEDQQRP